MDRPLHDYFTRIAELLATVEASDRRGQQLAVEAAAARAVDLLLAARAGACKVLLVGNGGSASIAGHLQMDLCNRVGVRAHMATDPPLLTALANDHGYPTVFERMVELWAEAGDCLVAISSSGRSENILRSVHAARAHGCEVITLSGFSHDNPLRGLGDVNFFVASTQYGEVEVVHHALAHFLTDHAAHRAAALPPA